MKANFFENPQYQKIVEDVMNMEKAIKGLEDSKKYNSDYIRQKENEARTAFTNDYNNFFEGYLQSLQEKMQRIQDKYQTNYDDIDVQKELLKRMDLERKLKLSSDDDLKKRVKDFQDTGKGEPVELEMLELELKQRGLETERVYLNAYKNEYNVDRPYMNDEEYQELFSESILAKQIQRAKLFYVDDGNGEYRPYSPKYS